LRSPKKKKHNTTIKREYNNVDFAEVTDKIHVYSKDLNQELWYDFFLLKIKARNKTFTKEDLLKIIDITEKLRDKVGLKFEVNCVKNDEYDGEIWILLFKYRKDVSWWWGR